MKAKTLKFCIGCLISVFFIGGCKTPEKIDNTYAYSNFGIECLGIEQDGSQTLRSWGKGRNKADAIEQAMKNAVAEVIFKGITSGSSECNKRPLLTTPNAREKFEYYFDPFFRDGGAYKSFVKLDEKRTSRIAAKNQTQENFGVVVTIDRSALRQRLIDDNILKP